MTGRRTCRRTCSGSSKGFMCYYETLSSQKETQLRLSWNGVDFLLSSFREQLFDVQLRTAWQHVSCADVMCFCFKTALPTAKNTFHIIMGNSSRISCLVLSDRVLLSHIKYCHRKLNRVTTCNDVVSANQSQWAVISQQPITPLSAERNTCAGL